MLHNRFAVIAVVLLSTLMLTGAQPKQTPPAPGFLGFSTGTIDGVRGMLQMHAVCQADFGPSARMCISKEFWLSPNATAPTADSWLHPSAGVASGVDFSGMTNAINLSCTAWTTTGGAGFVVSTTGKPGAAACAASSSVTCCAG